MKSLFCKKIWVPFLILLAALSSCGALDGNDSNGQFDCDSFSYGDTLVFIRPGQNYAVAPLSSGTGIYSASPDGLAINSDTGVIDVNASDTGLKYKISFTPTGSNQVCETFLTIGGVNYLDGVYVLNQNQSTASPIYNAVPGLPLPCDDNDDDDDDDDDDSSCNFDADNPTGQLLRDLGFEITSKGVFDLQKTVENGTFGSTPVNGTILDVELYYQLNDASALALNKIPIRFFYYDRLADVPSEVLDDIEQKRDLINENTSSNSGNLRILETIRPPRKPRPPYIVIVASFE